MELGHPIIEENVEVRYSLKYEHFRDKGLEFSDPELKFDTEHPEKNIETITESKKIVNKLRTIPAKYRQPLALNMKLQVATQKMKLFNTERRLELARKQMDIKRNDIIEQWKDIEEKESKLRQNFIDFNKFVKENYDKRFRAGKKLEDDRKLIEERQNNIDDITEVLDNMNTTTTKMDRKIRYYQPYKDFLQGVVDTGAFQSINDIVHTYNSQDYAKELLLRDQKSTMTILEHAQGLMMKLIEEKNFVIMGLNNQIANLQARYENANIKALESEALVTEIKNNAVKQMSEIDTVKNSIWNVYVHMATSKKHPIKIKKDNVEEQMMYINRTLTELSKVNKLIKKRSTKIK